MFTRLRPVAFTNSSVDGISYLWNFGDGSTSTAQAPTHTYTTGGTFEVSLVATTANIRDNDFMAGLKEFDSAALIGISRAVFGT